MRSYPGSTFGFFRLLSKILARRDDAKSHP
jgi:hypothetical protein